METCRPEDALAEVAQKMSEHAVASLPVIADDGGVISTITELDIAIAASIEGRKLIDLTVREAMSRGPDVGPGSRS
jgi:predicted transcriptional regulator